MDVLRVLTRPTAVPWRQRRYQLFKRALDVVVALAALVLLLPALILIALIIRLDSPGPALFVQERVGKGGRRFRMFKYRTLRQNVDEEAHRAFMRAFVQGNIQEGEDHRIIYKPFHKSEITAIGRFLRRTSLDELPQLINVLQGDMSLVGPRPNVPWEVEAYKEWHTRRLEVLPGITGLAQISGRSGLKFDVIAEYDIQYVEQQSLGLDWRILWRTLLAVFNGRGAH